VPPWLEAVKEEFMAAYSEKIDETRASNMASGRISIAGLAVAMVVGSLGVSLPYVALPTLSEAFGVSLQAVQWIVISYLLSITTLVVGAGRVGDIFGPRTVLLAGLSLFTVATLICAVAPAFWVLIVGRAVQGVGAAAIMALTLVIARQTVPKDAVGRVMGLLGTMSAIGTALGPTMGGVLTAQLGWRAIFLALIPLSLLSLALAFFTLPSPGAAKGRSTGSFDTAGTMLLGLSVGFYALALSGVNGGWSSTGLFLIALVGFGGFVLVERRVAAPLIQVTTMRDAKLISSLCSNMLTSTVMMATLVVGPFYLSRGLGLDVATVGVVVSVGPIIAAISGFPAGLIVDKFGTRAAIVAGLAQVLAGCIGLALLSRPFGVTGYVAAIAVLTSGYQLFLAANNTAVMLGAGEDQRGVISGMLTLSRNVGLSTGASLMSGIFASLINVTGLSNPGIVARGMNVTFAFGSTLILLALIMVIFGRRSTEASAND
jgi:MFS family permease